MQGPRLQQGVKRAGACCGAAGHFGTDCALSLDDAGRPQILAGTSYTTRTKRPWVYVYELPPEFLMCVPDSQKGGVAFRLLLVYGLRALIAVLPAFALEGTMPLDQVCQRLHRTTCNCARGEASYSK